MKTAGNILKKLSYPGRGIACGISPNGENLAVAYFLTGRSENSKNRVLIFKKNRVSTKQIDNNIQNKNLIIYDPVVKFKQFLIVSNGNQTETILKSLKNSSTFFESIETRNFENDPPIFTPRISMLAKLEKTNLTYKMAIIKKATVPCSTQRFLFNFYNPIKGQGHLIYTYNGKKNGNETTSFNKTPRPITIPNDVNIFLKNIWNALNPKNRISLFVGFFNLNTKKFTRKIVNQKQVREF